MVGNHNYMECRTFLCASPDKVNTGLMHPIELLHLQQLSVELDLTEIVHTFPYKTVCTYF